jgi:hypothetical protein
MAWFLSWTKALKWTDDHWASFTTAGLVSSFKLTDLAVKPFAYNYRKVFGEGKKDPLDAMKAHEFSEYALEWTTKELRKHTVSAENA